MNIIKDNTKASSPNMDSKPPTDVNYVNPDHNLKISVFLKKFQIFATAWSQNKCNNSLLDTAKILNDRQGNRKSTW